MNRPHLLTTSRRAFLRALGGIVAMGSGATAARPARALPEIHVATRNTRFGAVGRRTRETKTAFKPYPDRGWVGLPEAKSSSASLEHIVGGYAPARAFSGAELSADALSTLLFHTNGVTGRYVVGDRGIPLRAAPSAGANYAGEVYVVVQRVTGVPSGLYYYGVGRHRIVQLRRGSLLDEIGSALERPVRNAAVAVLLTNVVGRYTSHYANRGYRYALIDSGHIGENLRLAARALGLAETSPLRFWDDRLNASLGIDGWSECVCAVHLVGSQTPDGAGADASTPDPRGSDAPRPVETIRLREVRGAPSQARSPIERFHRNARLVPSDTPAAAVRAPEPDDPASGGIALPDRVAMQLPVHASIRARRSAESFAAGSVAIEQVASILAAAAGNTGLRRDPGVSVFLVAHRVAGLEAGVYRYAPNPARLLPLRNGRLASEMRAVCLNQQMAETAAAGFVMAVSSGSDDLGGRRYRDLLIESGAIAQRIYLAAEAIGLGARNLAAFVDDRFNEMLRLDRTGGFALHLTMVGPKPT